MLTDFRQKLHALASPAKAEHSKRFFKTGKGQYGENDRFLGLTVPQIRSVVKEFRALPPADVATLLQSEWHEERLAAVLILGAQYAKAKKDEVARKAIVDCYLEHMEGVNNWDIVDSSAPHILGAWCLEHDDHSMLTAFAATDHLWTQRIAIVATQAYIRAGIFTPTLAISETLLHHPHDLIHKAVGWMLREMGKKDRAALEEFLRKHCRSMPRTMLRYAIEKLKPAVRKRYLDGIG